MIGNLSCVRAAEYHEDRQFTLVQWLDTHSGDHTVFVFPPKGHLCFRSKEAGCVGEIFSTLLRQQNTSDHHVLQTLDKSIFWNTVGHTRVNLFPLIPHPFLFVCFFPFFRSACSTSICANAVWWRPRTGGFFPPLPKLSFFFPTQYSVTWAYGECEKNSKRLWFAQGSFKLVIESIFFLFCTMP